MMLSKGLTVLAVVLISICHSASAFDFDRWVNIELHHALDLDRPEHFTFRGNISIPSLNTGLSNAFQTPLTDQQLENLKTLAQRGGFYRLRATVVSSDDKRQTFLTYTKAYNLLDMQLNDFLTVSLDNNGIVVGISLTMSGVTYATDVNEVNVKDFRTDVLLRRTENAPVPDTASFVQKMEREREARERGEVPDKRGIFAKYWMYIIPVVLLVFLSGAGNQDAAK